MVGKIVKDLHVKAEDGSFPSATSYPIGTEQRYISAIRNSNNNNLEEQLLMGTDLISTCWKDEIDNVLVYKTRIEYRKDIANPTNFYVLEKIDYEVGCASRHYIDERPAGGVVGADDIKTLIINSDILSDAEEIVEPIIIQKKSLYFYKIWA